MKLEAWALWLDPGESEPRLEQYEENSEDGFGSLDWIKMGDEKLRIYVLDHEMSEGNIIAWFFKDAEP